MESVAMMFWGILFSGIGFGFFIYGRKQKKIIPFFVGISLFALPYLFSSVLLLVIVGIILISIPYFVKV